MRKRLTILLILLPSILTAQNLKIVTEELYPFNYTENGHVSGYSTEIVLALLNITGYSGNIEVMPWKRSYNIALTEPNVLIYTITRNKERENLFKWVGPIASREISLFRLRSRSDIKVKTLADAKRYSIGSLMGSAVSNQLIKEGFIAGSNIFPLTDETRNIKKLLHGHIDLILINDWAMVGNSRRLGINMNQFEKVLEIDSSKSYYLAFSRQTPDSTVELFQQALMELQPQIEILHQKYMPR